MRLSSESILITKLLKSFVSVRAEESALLPSNVKVYLLVDEIVDVAEVLVNIQLVQHCV